MKINATSFLKNSGFVIPSETIKTIYNTKSLVKKAHFRPSVKTKLDYKLKRINSFSKKKRVYKEVQSLHNGKASLNLSELSPNQLDAALDMYDFLYSKEFLKDEQGYLKKKRPLLVELSKNETPEVNISKVKGPHIMHSPSYVGFKSQTSKDYNQHSLAFRPAFHSYLEPTDGVMNYGEIVLGQVEVGVLENTNNSEFKFNLNHASWIKVSDHSPLLTYKWPVSWEFGLTSVRPLYNQSVLEHRLDLATGVSFSLGDASFFYLMNFYRLAVRGTGLSEKFQHEEGVKLGFRLKLSKAFYANVFTEGFFRNGFKGKFIDDLNYGVQLDLQWKLTNYFSLSAKFQSRFKSELYGAGLIYTY